MKISKQSMIDVNFGKLFLNAGGKVFQIDLRSGYFIKNLNFEYISSIIFKKVELTVPIESPICIER